MLRGHRIVERGRWQGKGQEQGHLPRGRGLALGLDKAGGFCPASDRVRPDLLYLVEPSRGFPDNTAVRPCRLWSLHRAQSPFIRFRGIQNFYGSKQLKNFAFLYHILRVCSFSSLVCALFQFSVEFIEAASCYPTLFRLTNTSCTCNKN